MVVEFVVDNVFYFSWTTTVEQGNDVPRTCCSTEIVYPYRLERLSVQFTVVSLPHDMIFSMATLRTTAHYFVYN